MNQKMTPAQVQELMDNNWMEEILSTDEFVEIQLPVWMVEMLLLLFPLRTPAQSLELICEQFLERKEQSKLN